ncbi:hypothetical protein [Bradyrhizobium yuanmingense]|uniref:hypothetical protein n=1 Tax=Bradyrhizobium yuanmingense TaxID=108015 RepID=UPI0023B9A24D|nr:hypothetical protein [Bradyrhizobium yuanmingense]MDF0579714.1 hypothetical protein [Bradyrhizobium yuanmingense]
MRSIQDIGKGTRRATAPVVHGFPAKDVDSHCEHHPVQQQCVAELCSSSPARPVSRVISGGAGNLAGAGGIEHRQKHFQLNNLLKVLSHFDSFDSMIRLTSIEAVAPSPVIELD